MHNMNAWQEKELAEDDSGLLEICDCCGKRIIHWNHIFRSILSEDGVRILCWVCKAIEDDKKRS
jgi:hypothetical protein